MAKKTGLTPSKLWNLRVREKSIQYYLQGNTTLKDVAERIKIDIGRGPSVTMVYNAIKAAMGEWETQNAEIITQYKNIELQKINKLEATYWDAWYRSCETPTITNYRKTFADGTKAGKAHAGNKKLPDYSLDEINVTTKNPVGDPKFLTGVEWCINKRLDIMASMAQPGAEADKPGSITTNTTVRQIIFRRRGDTESVSLTSTAQSVTTKTDE